MSDERTNFASVSYSVDQSGEFYIDVQIEDYSNETLSKLSLLVASIGTDAFDAQTLEILRAAFEQDGKSTEFTSFMTQLLLRQTILSHGKDTLEFNEESNKDKPIIKPTDLL